VGGGEVTDNEFPVGRHSAGGAPQISEWGVAMIEYLWIMIAAGFGLAGIAMALDKVREVLERGVTCNQKSLAVMEQRLVLEEESLAVNRKLLKQSEDSIAILNAIKENLEHRTIKN
jgi:hypothetical protein